MKKHLFQKFIAIMLTALFLCAVFPFCAFAAVPEESASQAAVVQTAEGLPVSNESVLQSAQEGDEPPASEEPQPTLMEIHFSMSEITLTVGSHVRAAFVTVPEDVEAQYVFSSDDESVATVDSEGNITAVSVGTAQITISAGDIGDTMLVRVEEAKPKLTGIRFSLADFAVAQGETVKTKLVAEPVGAAMGTVKYASSNEAVLRVDASGAVTGIKPGKVFIVAKTGNIKAYAFIEVKKAPTGIYLNETNVTLGLHENSLDLNAYCKGGYAYTKSFRSTNTKVITVNKYGIVEAVGIGKAYVKAQTFNGKQASCLITVCPEPKAAKFTAAKEVYQLGTMHPANAFVLNKGAAAREFKITSSNPKVVRVLKNGKLKARTIGTAVIMLTLYNGVKATKTITVKNNVILSINKQALLAACFCDSVERVIYGYSYQKRPLEAYIVNGDNYKKTLFIDFAVHGFEDDSYRDGKYLTAEGNKLVAYYAKYFAQLKDYRLVVVPCANPDGVVAGNNNLRACSIAFGRCTANHVDMNRDFLAQKAKETRALVKLLDTYRPDVYLNCHGWLNETIGTASLCKVINKELGLKYALNDVYAYGEGYAIGYVRNTYGIPCCLVEYASPKKVVHRTTVNMVNAIVKKY